MPAERSCTVVIVTKDRRDDLRDALASATQQRHPRLEVLVVDDGSSDGTAAMVHEEFPGARVERYEASAGLVVRRNDAARLATGDVLVVLDDDAVFSAPDIVAQSVADFDHPRIGAVAIPYVDVRHGPNEHQRAPDAHGRWVTSTFRGTAHALRRDVFTALGGYRAAIVHQGEEPDLTLRMLDAGYVVRLGRAAPIHHLESPSRNLHRMDVYGRRNEILLSTTHFPFPSGSARAVTYALRGLVHGARIGRVANQVEGIRDGVRVSWELRHERRPIRRETARLHRRLRRAGALNLHEIESALPPLAKPGSIDHRG